MKFIIEFEEGFIKIICGSDVQYVSEVSFSYNENGPVMSMSKELSFEALDTENFDIQQQQKFNYLDGKG